MKAALRLEPAASFPDLAKLAVVAERESPGRVDERLRVGELQRRKLGRAAEMDEERRRLDRAHIGRRGIVSAD